MSDVHQTTETTTAPVNTTEARTETGELKSQTPTSSNTTPSNETPESKPEGTTKPEAKPEGGAPETYADFTAPEGYTIDKALIDKALPMFKEMGLTQEQAQQLVSLQVEREIAAAKGPQEAYETLRSDWRKEVLADSTLGANGKLLPEVSANIAKVVDSLGPEMAKSFREVMDITGVGDHPTFVRALNALAANIAEGKHVTGKNPSPHGQTAPDAKPKSIANAMFPNLP